MHGVNRNHLPSYLDEFVWRKNIASDRVDVAEQLIAEIARQFPAMRPQRVNPEAEVYAQVGEVDSDTDLVSIVGDGRYTGPLPLYADEEPSIDFDEYLLEDEPIAEPQGIFAIMRYIKQFLY